MAALAELRNSLRSGDVWVPGSRQFKDFGDYLLPKAQFAAATATGSPTVTLPADGNQYLEARLTLLAEKLERVEQLASTGELPADPSRNTTCFAVCALNTQLRARDTD